MKHLMITVLVCISASLFGQNSCAEAQAIDFGVTTVGEIDGEAPAEFCFNVEANNAEWYTFSSETTTGLVISTSLDQNNGLDTRVQVYSGSCGNLICEAEDDDSGDGYLSLLSMNADAGETYYIVFDNRWSSAGFDVLLQETNPQLEVISFTTAAGGASGSVIVDMNGDTRDDIVNVAGSTLTIWYQQEDGTLESSTVTTPDPDFGPSWSIAAGDLDANGYTDLLYGGGSGVTFMFANDNGTAFTEVSGPEYVFSQRSNMVDLNNDGHLDAFVCHDVDPNVYYLNDGTGNLTFFQGGLGDDAGGGNYGSVWIDVNNDNKIDMFIAKCRGGNSELSTDELHLNMGNGVFQEVAADYNLDHDIQTWSSAWGDFDNDGDMDVFVGASSTSNGTHKFMRNDGNTFTDVTAGSGFDMIPNSTSIENCTQDFNNDGWIDILGAGGNMMLNNGDMTFTATSAGVNNGPIGDVNGDGHLDIISGGLQLNDGNDNNHLRVHLQGVESNSDGVGARVEVTSALGTQIRDIRAGEGFRYMSSITAHFGIAQDTEIEQVLVHWPSGEMDVIYDPEINTTLYIVEGSNSVGLDEVRDIEFNVFPTVTSDQLSLSLDGRIKGFEIIDAQGRVIREETSIMNSLDVSGLSAGAYYLRAYVDGQAVQRSFVKR